MSRSTREKGNQASGRLVQEQPEGPIPGGRPSGLSPAGTKIVAAFEEAIAVMQAADRSAGSLTASTYRVDFATRAYSPDDVRQVRGLLGMSQVLFARFLGVDANTIRAWEQGTRPPSAIARRFMTEIEMDPDYWRRRVAPSLAATSAEGPTGT